MLLICFVLGGFARFFQVWQIYPCPMSEGLQLFQSRHIPVPVWSCYWVVAWMQAEDASTVNSVRYALDGMEQKERWESTKRVLLPTSGYIIVVILALLTLDLNYWNLKMRNHYESILFLMSCSVSHLKTAGVWPTILQSIEGARRFHCVQVCYWKTETGTNGIGLNAFSTSKVRQDSISTCRVVGQVPFTWSWTLSGLIFASWNSF